MEKYVREHNILIKYRNTILKSKKIDPEIYFIILEFFNDKYCFLDQGIYLKNSKTPFHWTFIDADDVINEIRIMFGYKRGQVHRIISQIKDDNKVYLNLLEENVNDNWCYITTPDMSDSLDDYPF